MMLPISFSVPRLKEDLAKVAESEWMDHFNSAVYEKEWRCVPLRSVEGRKDHILPILGVAYRDTEILSRCSYFREVVDSFECEKTSVRLMSLGPGSRIGLHRDLGTSFEDGMARLHVPIQTSSDAVFRVEDEEVHFSAGNTWYLNADCLHGVRNDSSRSRIHLMLDCVVNPWLEKVFLDAGFKAADGPRYRDPAIGDENVEAVIAALLAMNTETGRKIAENLAALRCNDAKP